MSKRTSGKDLRRELKISEKHLQTKDCSFYSSCSNFYPTTVKRKVRIFFTDWKVDVSSSFEMVYTWLNL